MTCTACKTSYAPHDLAGGLCLNCLHKEATALRLVLGHTIMAIESGQHDKPQATYTQMFSQAFVDHLRRVLNVNNESTKVPLQESAPKESQTVTASDVGEMPKGIV